MIRIPPVGGDRGVTGVVAGLLAVVPACTTSRPLAPERTAELLAAQPQPAACQRIQGRVRIDSSGFCGEFLAVLLVRHQPLAVRLQLFPDLGGKVLDLAADPQRQAGELPMTGQRLRLPGGPGDRLLEMFASSLLEAHTRIQPERVRAAAAGGSGTFRLELTPRYGASRCQLEVDGAWRRRTFHITRRGASWQLRLDGRRATVQARGFALTAEATEIETVDRLPDALFTLDQS